jgi:hypothetical protein
MTSFPFVQGFDTYTLAMSNLKHAFTGSMATLKMPGLLLSVFAIAAEASPGFGSNLTLN